MSTQSIVIPDHSQDLQRQVKLSLQQQSREIGHLLVELIGPEAIRLSGTVRTFYGRQLAITTAKRVPGVRQVTDDIMVH